MVIIMPKWLKTQDETGLVEAKGLIDVCSVKKSPDEWLICCEGLWLGTYSSQARAKEVLQLISGFLSFDSSRVFAMPKE